MKQLYTTLFLLSIALSTSVNAQNHSHPKPDQIIEIFRHGARAPLHDDDPFWPPSEYGELTPVGMRQQYVLGKTLAERYPNLLGTSYNYSQIYVLSDSVPRTVQSAVSQLYGVYLGTGPGLPDGYPTQLAVPPFQDPIVQQIANTLSDTAALPFMNVPNIVNIISDANAYIFEIDNTTVCPNSIIWQDQNYADAAAAEALTIFAPTIANLNQYLDESDQIVTLEDLKGFGDVLLADLIDDRPLPWGFSDDEELITNITYAFSWIALHVWGGQEIQRTTNSFGLLNATLDQLAAFRQGENYSTVAMFSGHDENLYTLLAALGLANESCVLANFYSYIETNTLVYPLCYYPVFASNLIVEFFNSTDAPYVKLLYNNKIVPLCDGKNECPYDEFVSVIQNAYGYNTLQTYYEMCGANAEQVAALGYDNLVIDGQESLFSVPIKNRLSTEMAIIMGLVMVIMMLVSKVVFDQRRYNKLSMEFKAERLFYSEIKEVKVN